MRRLIYQVYVGKSSKLYDTCIESVSRYAEKYAFDHIVQKEPILNIKPDINRTGRSKEAVEKLGYLPIFEKENAFDYFDRYDQIAIIDSDIYVKDTAPNIFNELNDYAFAGVVERDLPCTKKYRNKITKYSKNAFNNLKDVDWKWNSSGAEFYNMGMMLLNKNFRDYIDNQSAKEFLLREEFKDFIDGVGFFKWSTDQMLLNWFIKKYNVPCKKLSWQYNALYKGIEDNKLKESYFVHFFLKDLLPDKGENIKKLLKDIQ